jgi:beta-N-acetylhexosaminidase
MGVDSAGLSAEASQVLRSRDVGSVFLVGNSTAGIQTIRRLTDTVRATAGARTDMLVAADQEGGLVQRLQGPGFERIPSAADQAQLSPSALRTDAKRWGQQLASAGVDVDLAPVADVVPAWLGSGNAPIGALHRGYGSDPSTVAQHVLAFAEGMRAAGRGATVKHFPGLGQVRGNTDFSGNVVDDQTRRHDPYLKPFAAAVKAGVPMVMVSLATYTRIDPKRRAVFSATVISGMLRNDLGFDGVVVSDDLGAAAEVASVPAGNRALEFLDAGGDLITVTSPSVAADMSTAIVHAIRADPQFAAAIHTKVTRVLELKHQLGLLHCG